MLNYHLFFLLWLFFIVYLVYNTLISLRQVLGPFGPMGRRRLGRTAPLRYSARFPRAGRLKETYKDFVPARRADPKNPPGRLSETVGPSGPNRTCLRSQLCGERPYGPTFGPALRGRTGRASACRFATNLVKQSLCLRIWAHQGIIDPRPEGPAKAPPLCGGYFRSAEARGTDFFGP
jgi:hypothetical protein